MDPFPLACPSCRRVNSIGPDRTDPARCSRCRCNLESLALIRQTAAAHSRLASASLAAGQPARAARHAEASWPLDRLPETAACAMLAAILQGNPDHAAHWLLRLQHQASSAAS